MSEIGTGDRKTGAQQAIKHEPMKKGQEYAFSPQASVIDANEVGFTNGMDGYDYKVITGLDITHSGVTLLLVQETAPSGVTTEKLFPASVGTDGQTRVIPTANPVTIPNTGETLVVGRRSSGAAQPGEYKVDLEGMLGEGSGVQSESLSYASRRQLSIRRDPDTSIRVVPFGQNGTEYWVPQKKLLIEVSDAPRADASRVRVAASLAVTQAGHESAAPVQEGDPRAKLQAQEASLMAQLSEMKAPFNEDVQLDLWRYASGKLNKADAQRNGDGQGSIIYGQQTGQAYRDMPPEAKAIAEQYYGVFSNLQIVRDRIQALADKREA